MAQSSIETYGLLNFWAEYMGVNVWHWNGVTGAGIAANLANIGEDAWVQPERDTIAQGINRAFSLMRKWLNFAPLPLWYRERVDLRSLWYNDPLFIPLNTRYIQTLGTRAVQLIQSGASVVYSDTDGDGIDDTGTITVTLPTGVTGGLRVFFRVSDGATSAADPLWQIIPIRTTISATTATITAHRSQFVKPSIWKQPYTAPNYNRSSKNLADTSDASDFVTTVDVFRVYADTTDAVQLIDSTGTRTSVTAYIDDPEEGFIRLSEGDFSLDAVAVEVNYQAGYALDSYGNPQRDLMVALFRLANCEAFGEGLALSTERAAIIQQDNLVQGIGNAPVDESPLGAKLGQVAAWKTIQQYYKPNALAR